MFKKAKRYSFQKGQPKNVLSTPFFVLRFQDSDSIHVAVVVSKKIDKRATVRNKLKRSFTNALEQALQEVQMQKDLVFYLKKKSLEHDMMKEELVKVLQNL